MKVLRLVLGVALWLLVLGLAMISVSAGGLRRLVADSDWLSGGTTVQATMLASSLVLMITLSRGKLARYGFRAVTRGQIKPAFVFGSIAAVVVQVALALLWRLVPVSGGHPAVAGASLLQVVVTVWIVASICEEVLHRGLIQGFLEPLRSYGVAMFGIRLSLPVITAAILFGATHIMLLTMGADAYFVGGIVGSATVLGIVAGYYREKTGSLLPAILIHMLFNIYGAASAYIQRLAVK
jgi:membrane protease YdiL (CAAX protease family)